jgi:hypothetical protein
MTKSMTWQAAYERAMADRYAVTKERDAARESEEKLRIAGRKLARLLRAFHDCDHTRERGEGCDVYDALAEWLDVDPL